MEMNSSGFNVSTIFCGLTISQLLLALLYHISVLYRPIQAPMTTLSYVPLRPRMCLLLHSMQSPGRAAGNQAFDECV